MLGLPHSLRGVDDARMEDMSKSSKFVCCSEQWYQRDHKFGHILYYTLYVPMIAWDSFGESNSHFHTHMVTLSGPAGSFRVHSTPLTNTLCIKIQVHQCASTSKIGQNMPETLQKKKPKSISLDGSSVRFFQNVQLFWLTSDGAPEGLASIFSAS